MAANPIRALCVALLAALALAVAPVSGVRASMQPHRHSGGPTDAVVRQEKSHPAASVMGVFAALAALGLVVAVVQVRRL